MANTKGFCAADDLFIRRLFRLPGGGLLARAVSDAATDFKLSKLDLDQVTVLGMKVFRAG